MEFLDLLSKTKNFNVPDLLLWKKDRQSQFIDLNENFAHFFGFKNVHEVLGTTDYALKSPAAELADVFRDCDKRILNDGNSKQFFEIIYSAKKELRIIFVTKSPIFDKFGVIGIFGHAQDITNSFAQLGALLSRHHPSDRKKLSAKCFQFQKYNHIVLTPRQEECLFFLLHHKTAKQIAQILKISLRTVEDHIEQLKIKFRCFNKNQLMQEALGLGYFNFIPASLLNNQLSIALE